MRHGHRAAATRAASPPRSTARRTTSSAARTEAIVDLGIALVPEGRRLFPRLTVEENLLLGAFRKKARAQIKTNMEFCFECFPRLAERRCSLPAP